MRHILVTGSSSGIGLALTEKLAGQSFVYCLVRNPDKMNRLIQERSIPGDSVRVIEADLNSEKQINKAFESVDTLDVVVNNAGYGLYGAFEEIPADDFRQQFETNFFGSLQVIRRSLPMLRKSKQAKILNVTSILGRIVLPTGSAYCSSKWAFEAVSEALRYELAPFHIQVCAVEPGLIRTGFKSAMQTTKLDENSRYGFLNRLISEEMQQYGKLSASARKAADKIAKLIRKNRLPARYRIGTDAFLVHILTGILPAGVLDAGYRYFTRRLYSKSLT